MCESLDVGFNEMSQNLPSQRELSRLDSIVRIIIPPGAKFDVLSRMVIRKTFFTP
jgi:hypothetical protein